MKEKNLNISQDSTCCTMFSNDTNTVVTEVMATTDEDSFDISPVPRSPKSQVVTTNGLLGVGSGSSSSATGGSSSSSTSGSRSASIVSSSKYSNSRKRTSSDRKKSISRSSSNGSYDDPFRNTSSSTTNGNSNGGLGLQPRSISRLIFSPAPYTSHKRNGSGGSIGNNGGAFGSSIGSNNFGGGNPFRSYRVPSIEPCHSFDSHDSNTTSCSNNDFLANMMDPNNSNNINNHNNSGMNNNNATNQMTYNSDQHQYPQSISKPTQYTTGWSSSFIFSGSPIEEEENEDSCSPFHHLNGKGKKPKRVDERRLFDSIDDGDSSMNVQSSDMNTMDVGMRLGGGGGDGNGEEDQFSSKIRRLNLDGEMVCTNDDTIVATTQDKGVFVPLRSSGTSMDRLSFSSSDEGAEGGNDNSIEAQQRDQQKQQQQQLSRAGSVKTQREDSFRLHVNTDFQSSLNDDTDDEDMMKEGNLKTDDNQISPNDVAEFAFPIHPLCSISSKTQAGSNSGHSNNNATSFKTMFRNTESPLPPPTIGEDDYIVPPPNTFSSPPPLVKKGLHDPPSPYRMGRIQNLNMPLPPTTPMVPQKAMRRMRGNNDICPSPFLDLGIPSSGRSNRSSDEGSTPFNRKSRFYEDFEILDTLGNGSFGTVYKCRQRVDGRLYAVKAAKRRAKGRADRERMLKEVVALAELSDAAGTTAFHILRYHQAWMEEDKLHIVTELCTSTLQIEMHSGIFRGNTKRLYKLLREMLLALRLIHQHDLVHLDIKPENIFVREDTFKLGDFGLVSKVSVQDDVEEGDSRYMCMDLLSGNHEDLTKVRILFCSIFLFSS